MDCEICFLLIVPHVRYSKIKKKMFLFHSFPLLLHLLPQKLVVCACCMWKKRREYDHSSGMAFLGRAPNFLATTIRAPNDCAFSPNNTVCNRQPKEQFQILMLYSQPITFRKTHNDGSLVEGRLNRLCRLRLSL